MASSSSLAKFKGGSLPSDSLETVEIDPQFASGLGLHLGDIVYNPTSESIHFGD